MNRNYESRIIAERKNRPQIHNLPKGWILERLAAVGEIVTGTTPPKLQKDFYGNDYPFFKPTDLNNGYYVRNSDDGLSKKRYSKSKIIT